MLSTVSEITVSAVDPESVVDSVSIRMDAMSTTVAGNTLTISVDPDVLGPGLHIYDGGAWSAGGEERTAQIFLTVPP